MLTFQQKMHAHIYLHRCYLFAPNVYVELQITFLIQRVTGPKYVGILKRIHISAKDSKGRNAHQTFSPCWISFSLGFTGQPLEGGLNTTVCGKAGLPSLKIL